MVKSLISKFKFPMRPTTNKRALYYWAKLYTGQLKEKEEYSTTSRRYSKRKNTINLSYYRERNRLALF